LTETLYKYTDAEIKQILKTMMVLVDTREKENRHIIEFFDKSKIGYIYTALKFGDYSYMLPASPEFGIARDMYFTDQIVIERKANLEELSGNLSHKREQFENEFLRAGKTQTILMVEGGSLDAIYEHNYRTELKEKPYIASLHTFSHRYGLSTAFVSKKWSGNYICGVFSYHLREYLI
jgi:ERCC4-type nuclease